MSSFEVFPWIVGEIEILFSHLHACSITGSPINFKTLVGEAVRHWNIVETEQLYTCSKMVVLAEVFQHEWMKLQLYWVACAETRTCGQLLSVAMLDHVTLELFLSQIGQVYQSTLFASVLEIHWLYSVHDSYSYVH